jgi:amino acid adenylation domain-containing protein
MLSADDQAWLASQSWTVQPTNSFSEFESGQAEGTIVQRFESRVKLHGARVAVKTGNCQWTYDHLNRRANQVARAILETSGEGMECVGLMFAHDSPMLAAMLGVMKAGKAYVPLDPLHPHRRLAHILKDSLAGVVLADSATATLAEELHTEAEFELVNIDYQTDAVADDNLNLTIPPDSIAYLLYTSGTTGEPKGVAQSHRNLLNHIRVYTNNLHIACQDHLTLLSTYGFDAAIMDIYGALLNGATLHPFDLRTEGLSSLGSWLNANEITIYHSTPTVYRHFVGTLRAKEKLDSVRLVVLGGEQVNRADWEKYKRHFPRDSIFVNGYGPTESTLALQAFLNHDSPMERSTVPIGYAVEGTDALLVNEAGQDVEVFGEIAISSPHVALGYWRNAEATAASFSPDPMGSSARVYRTGDLGRLLPDGQLEFIGRKDTQVKIRGFRVELGEIEAQLARHPSIREAAAVARRHESGDLRIAAFLVSEDENAPDIQSLLEYLGTRLPDYMLPAAIHYLPTLPLTQTGKLDRRALPRPDWSRARRRGEYVAPQTPAELMLAECWSQVLGVSNVGVYDGFFDLGGHSLLAVQLLALINKKFDVDLPLAALFQAPTIKQLAELIAREKRSATATWSPLVSVQPAGTKPPLFVVPGNVGNVFTDLGNLAQHLGPDQPFYGLQDGPQNPVRIEAIAARYVGEIRRVKEEGPYLLAGVCSGAVVAFEMAQQLRAQDETVPLLAMVEPSLPQRPGLRTEARFLSSVLRTFGQRIRYHIRSLAQLSSADQGEYTRLRLKVVANSWALRHYAPRVYAGRIELFLTEQSLAQSSNRHFSWHDFAEEGAHVHTIPGSHATIVGLGETPVDETHMRALADKMNACIERALEGV